MKNISILILILVQLLISCDQARTYRSIKRQSTIIVLRKSSELNSNKELYLFNGTTSNWYTVDDYQLFDKVNVGDTLRNVVIWNYTYYSNDYKSDSTIRASQNSLNKD